MSIGIAICPGCNAQNISTAAFCGQCGAQSLATPQNDNAAFRQTVSPAVTASPEVSSNHWHGMAGVICGVVSVFLCGLITAVPGLYFSWSSLSQAKQTGESKSTAYVGLGLNSLGIVLTVLAVLIFLCVGIMQANTSPYGYGY